MSSKSKAPRPARWRGASTLWVAALLALAPLWATAEDAGPDWTLRCSLSGQALELRFHSPSGDLLEDDLQVALHSPGAGAVPIDLPPAGYARVRFVHRRASLCEGSDAFELGPGRLLVLLSYSRRPGLDGVAAVWLDVDKARVLDARLLPGEHLAEARLKSGAARLRLQLVRAYQGAADQDETPRLGWIELRAMGDRLHVSP